MGREVGVCAAQRAASSSNPSHREGCEVEKPPSIKAGRREHARQWDGASEGKGKLSSLSERHDPVKASSSSSTTTESLVPPRRRPRSAHRRNPPQRFFIQRISRRWTNILQELQRDELTPISSTRMMMMMMRRG